MQTELHTAADVFRALGGIKDVATIAGASYSAASNWKAANRFPSKTFLSISSALHRKGLDAPASLWGMVESEQVAS